MGPLTIGLAVAMTIDSLISDAEPYAPPSDLPSSNVDLGKKASRTQILLVSCMYAVLAGEAVFIIFHHESLVAYYVCSIAFAILATTWAINDSRRRGATFHPVLRMLYLFTCPISTVLYLVFTRGFRGLGLAAVHALGMIVVSSVAFYGAFYAISFSGYWELYDPIYLEP